MPAYINGALVILGIHGVLVAADVRLPRPDWLGPFTEELAAKTSGDASHLHLSYEAHMLAVELLGRYEIELSRARNSGVKYTEGGDSAEAVINASNEQVSCSVHIRPSDSGAHSDIDCVAAPTVTVAPTTQPPQLPAPGRRTLAEPDFRGAKWGMSKAEVVASEHVKLGPLPEDNDTLAGQDTIGGSKFWVFFEFVDGRLGRANYSLLDTYTEPNLYILAAERVVNAIAEKYGQPNRQVEWRNELFRNDPLKYGLAISAGHLVIRNNWETDRTKIIEVTSGANYKTTVAVRYIGKEFEAAFAQKQRDAQRKVF